jgi:hypothetical protein
MSRGNRSNMRAALASLACHPRDHKARWDHKVQQGVFGFVLQRWDRVVLKFGNPGMSD